VDEKPPLLTTPGGSDPGDRPPARGARSHLPALVVGSLIGLAAVAAALFLVLRSNDGSASSPPPPAPVASTPQLEVLRIVFPEGFTRVQMSERIVAVNEIAERERGLTTSLVAKDYLDATARRELPASVSKLPAGFFDDEDVVSFEGFLFPATYEFTEATTSLELVDLQLEAFGRAWGEIDMTSAAEKNLTPYDVLIIASMIEGEVSVPRERALVAAVIYNRLQAGMPLGIDATIRYGLKIPPDRAIRQSELENPNPYNTRIHRGLPPTPINNPGLAAIEAAANPGDVDYLYFVRKKDCKSHFFTASEQEILRRLEQPRC
jgi:uncharacterized YceG family protein